MNRRRLPPVLLVLLLGAFAPALLCPAADAERQVNLISFGDWGHGNDLQRRVATTMASYVGKLGTPVNGALLVGDNFYVPLESVADKAWDDVFERAYDPARLNFPFYAILGNHDYEYDKPRIQMEYARLNPASRWKMPARWYRIDFPADDPVVSVIMLDSNKAKLGPALWAEQIAFLREQLAALPADRWKVVCAHHPLFSNGLHGDIGPLQRMWGQWLKDHGVDFYLCGHDHDLQHLQVPGWQTSFLLVGGASDPRPMRRDDRGPFARGIAGFAHLRFTADRAEITFIDGDGDTAHAFERTRDHQVRVITTTGRDRGFARPATRPD